MDPHFKQHFSITFHIEILTNDEQNILNPPSLSLQVDAGVVVVGLKEHAAVLTQGSGPYAGTISHLSAETGRVCG